MSRPDDSDSNRPSLAGDAVLRNPILSSLGDSDRIRLSPYFERIDHEPGAVVVREGDDDRAMYFVLSGEGRITSGDVDVGAVRPGEHFGELGLVAGRPRAATIAAATDLELVRLSPESFEAMLEADAPLALRFLRALMDGVATRLADMTESVGLLLRERSLPRRTEVAVTIEGKRQVVRTGTPLRKLLPERVGSRPVVAALVDRKAVALTAPVGSHCQLSPLTTVQWEGQRIYRHSLALLLLEASYAVDPELRVSMAHSVGFAQRVRVALGNGDVNAIAGAIESKMRELSRDSAPLREEWWTVDEAREHFAALGWSETDALLSTWRDPAVPLVSYGSVYALRLGPLVPDASVLTGFHVVPDGNDLLLVYGAEAESRAAPADVSWTAPADDGPRSRKIAGRARDVSRHTSTMTQEQERWLETLRMGSVGTFNRACIDGDVTQLIQVSEGFQEKRISQVADEIRDRADVLKVVTIAGPSSSGKTTFIRRLKVQLQVNGIRPIGISLDDYYIDRDKTPKSADGEFDFEAFEALRGDLLGDHLHRLLSGETVQTARYDFVAGKSHHDGGPTIQLGENEILMLEGIHGLNPRLAESIPSSAVFRVFVCPLAQLPFDRVTRVHASDLRLLRRIIRDRHSRGHDAAATIARWPSVRAGERQHIFPHQENADAVFDTSLIYEPSVLKVYAERYLLEVPHGHESYTTAFRLLQLIDRFVAIYPDHVPPTSILREFIGGSGFEY